MAGVLLLFNSRSKLENLNVLDGWEPKYSLNSSVNNACLCLSADEVPISFFLF